MMRIITAHNILKGCFGIQKHILTDDENYHGTKYIKRLFWYLLVLISNSYKIDLQKPQIWPKMARTSDTLIGYLPIFQMLPKFSLCIRYRCYSFE